MVYVIQAISIIYKMANTMIISDDDSDEFSIFSGISRVCAAVTQIIDVSYFRFINVERSV